MKITLVPNGGLCNRLNSIVSGLAYKQTHPDTELSIFWQKRHYCKCRFSDLFKQLPDIYPPVKEMGISVKDAPGYWANLKIPQLLRPLWYDCSILTKHNSKDFDNLTNGKNRVYVHKDNLFCKETFVLPYSTIFRPIDQIQEKINRVTENLGAGVVGLHIRRGDNEASIRLSPMQFFYDAIEKEIALNKDVLFYLATDDDSVKQQLAMKYGDRVISTQLSLDRCSVQGMQDAVVDLYCLARTSKIYGSKQSSYSTFASKIFNIEVIK